MANISISDLCNNNSESTLFPLDRTNKELVKEAIARALSVRGGLATSGVKPDQTDGMFPTQTDGMFPRDRGNGSPY